MLYVLCLYTHAGEGVLRARGCISWMLSPLSQVTRARLARRTSASCGAVKGAGLEAESYQNLSPACSRLNWSPTTQRKVGPSSEPAAGVSEMPPMKRSTSSTCL